MKRFPTRTSAIESQLFPLHRSVTDGHYDDKKSSPITRFVCKLLGINKPAPRPRLGHKSHSTTSITKSSVISSHQQPSPTSTPIDALPDHICLGRNKSPSGETDEDEDDDDCCSINSSSTLNTTTDSSSVSSSSVCSPAVGALVSASQLPTRYSSITSSPRIRFVDFDAVLPSPKLVHRRPDTAPALVESTAEQLRPYLPRRYRLAQQWNLLYSLDQHGSSLSTLYTMLQDAKGPCLLVLKDEDSHLFGAYLNEPLHVSSSFYGTGECFLWKLTDAVVPDASHHPPPKIKVFPWTGKNEYMIVSEPSFVAFGGGDGKFGLWLNSDLERGHSEPCPTFDNEALSPHPQFSCIELEIWGFQI